MRAFRRFSTRRSVPQLIISDNAPIFTKATITLGELCNKESVSNPLNSLNMAWYFAPVNAPHFGGARERLIGLTIIFLNVLGRALVTLCELQTILCEKEALLNDRPLTYISVIIDEVPLTHSHLLRGHRTRALSNICVDLDELGDPTLYEKKTFQNREMRVRLLLHQFWRRLKNEYHSSLLERDRNLILQPFSAFGRRHRIDHRCLTKKLLTVG